MHLSWYVLNTYDKSNICLNTECSAVRAIISKSAELDVSPVNFSLDARIVKEIWVMKMVANWAVKTLAKAGKVCWFVWLMVNVTPISTVLNLWGQMPNGWGKSLSQNDTLCHLFCHKLSLLWTLRIITS